jgi:hypothetical protein
MNMNEKIYQTCKFLAIGILIGYFGKYALYLAKTKLAQRENLEEDQERAEY